MDISKDNFQLLEEKCLIDKPVQCGSYTMSVMYFTAYTAVISLVLLNLFVAVVLEGFDGSNDTDEREVISVCCQVWKLYDKNLTMELDLMKVPVFVDHVQEELRKRKGDEVTKRGIGMKQTYFVLGLMDVVVDDEGHNKVRFRQAVEAVIRLLLAEEREQAALRDSGKPLSPEDFRDFAAELDHANKIVHKREGDSFGSRLDSLEAPPIVQELAVQRMQASLRKKNRKSFFADMSVVSRKNEGARAPRSFDFGEADAEAATGDGVDITNGGPPALSIWV
jgi:hypothetical protein